MGSLFRQEGASLRVEILGNPAVREFIDAHASVLDSSFEKTPMSEEMRRRLHRSDFVFSGLKTFHELNEAFPSLVDENGDRKPFERFLNDVLKIDRTYNANYLRAEYNFVAASADMAARWEEFAQDGERYNLQYRTQRDGRVREEHAALDGVTLPPSDPFWTDFYPPNGWNCRCTVVQVRKSKYPATDHDEAVLRGEEALKKDSKGMFRFNPGQQGKTVPDYNPYTISRCRNCDIAKGKGTLARKTPPASELCAVCKYLHNCENIDSGCTQDEIFGKRLLISNSADMSELEANLRGARSLLSSFPEMRIKIREHVMEELVKNPEYLINDLIGDRKGIGSESGVRSGFQKAIRQHCKVVILDLDMHPDKFKTLRTTKLARAIQGRYQDFVNGIIKECYVVFDNQAVCVDSSVVFIDPHLSDKQNRYSNTERIENILKKIRGNRSNL